MQKTSKNTLYCLMAFGLLLFSTSCKKHSDPTPLVTDVYVAGYTTHTSGVDVATYWKNGVAVDLTSGTTAARALAVAVNGDDVYVVGNNNGKAACWKNGKAVDLNDNSRSSNAYGIVIDGKDVYISGSSYNPLQRAFYWKNGNRVVLSDVNSQASGIVVYKHNIYLRISTKQPITQLFHSMLLEKQRQPGIITGRRIRAR